MAGFAKFDLKTWTIVGGAAKAIEPKAAGSGRRESSSPMDTSRRKCTIRAVESSAASLHGAEPKSEKTFIALPRVVTRTAQRNMTLFLQVLKAHSV